MTTHFKITKSLLEQIRVDLSRAHPFAFERVGFLFVRPGTATLLCNLGASHNLNGRENIPPMKPAPKWYSSFVRRLNTIQIGTPGENDRIDEFRTQKDTLRVLAVSYSPVDDEDYIDDPTVGAKIGSAAIRSAMQKSLDTGMGVIHVHLHEGLGRPGFSSTDRKSMSNLIQSFFNVSPNTAHGALVINQDSMAGVMWKSKKDSLAISRVSIIGYPCEFTGGVSYV